MKTSLVVSLLLTVNLAHADAPPPWCKGVKHEQRASYVDTALDPKEDPDRVMDALVMTLCDPRDDERPRRAELEAARQQLMKRMAMSEADWAGDGMEWTESPNYLLRALAKQPWSKVGALEQYALMTQLSGNSVGGAKHYFADAVALTETGRFGYIDWCLHQGGEVDWALCQPDIDALDRAKLGQELRADTAHTPEDRMRLRFELAKVERYLPKHAAKVKALFEKDKAYEQLFAIARDTRTAYEARAGKDLAPLRALVLAMDDARATRSRSALAGCSDKTWPAFAAEVAKLPAKAFENLRGADAMGPIVHDPAAYLAATALVACEGPRDYLLTELEQALGSWPGFRGPRTAAITALVSANLEPDERGQRIALPGVGVALALGSDKSPYAGAKGTGIIASVTERGDAIEIAFAKTSELQDNCLSERETNKVVRIDSDGNLIRERICTKWATERINTTPAPVTVPKRYGGALQKGRYVVVSGGGVMGVWAKPNAPLPLAMFGVQLAK